MATNTLTNAEVKNAKAQEKDYSLFDGFGLVLYISKTGGKSWRFRYVHPVTGKRQTYTIGKYPEYTLAEAREERDQLRKLVSRGRDPNEVKKERKSEQLKAYSQTFKLVASEWLNIKKAEDKRYNTMKFYKSVINHLNKLIGDMPVTKVRAAHTIHLLKEFSDRPVQQQKIISTANAIMNFSVNSGIIDNNPLAKISKAFPSVKNQPLPAIPKEMLIEFLAYWNAAGMIEPVRLALKFQILTMVRPLEAIRAAWEEIDTESGLWVIPAKRMKCAIEHIVPLSTQALELIEKAKVWKRNDFVFPSLTKPISPINKNATLHRIHGSKFKGIAVPHGFRALASTVLNDEGFNPDVIEAALAHKSGNNIRDIYNRTTYLEQRKVMMQWWGEFIEAAERGEILETNGDKGLRQVC